MRERMVRVRGGARYRLEIRDEEDIAVVILAFAPDGALAGKARAVRLRHEPGAAEVRITVDSTAHGGLDGKLLDVLRAEARAVGIDRLTGRVVLDDTAAQRLLVARGAACWLAESELIAFELPASRRARTVPPVVAQRRQFGRLAS